MIEELLKNGSHRGRKSLFLFFLIFCFAANAQTTTVTGTVTDDTGPIPGVTVLVEGTSNGTTTDFNGDYTLSDVPVDATLQFSFVGFATTELPVDGRSSIDVTLQEDTESLDEIVVVGYGTQQKSDVTGAVSSANLEAFRESPNTNIAQSLQGSVPGLNVGQVNAAGATPSINIRGTSSISGNQDVLIVLDGIQYNGSLSSINPDDIQSIDVLKDASSTAVYGAQAANGVILITTKSGKRNQEPRITVTSSYTTQTPTADLRPMQREEYVDYLTRLRYDEAFLAPDYINPNPDFNLADGLIDQIQENGELVDTDYNWWDEGTQTGFVQENKVNVTGGSEAVSYLISLGLTEQEGFIKNDNFQRKSVRVNLDADATDWWNVGIQTFGSFTNQDGDEPTIWGLVVSPPLLTPYDENGDLIPNPTGTLDANPFLGSNVDDYERHDYFFANIYSDMDIPFIDGLSYRINFGNNYRIDKYYGASIYGAGLTGDAGKEINFYQDYTLDNILTYNKGFGKHEVNLTLLYGAMERRGDGTNAYARGFNRLTLGYNDLSVGSTPEISSSAYSENLNYQMFRMNYKFDNRYLITGTIRRDGFSGFAENNKYGYFPSGAIAWNVSNEGFMEDTEWVNNLKLRAGYGLSGNQTSRYSSLARLTTRPAYVFGDGSGTAFGQELTSLSNSDLRWEKTAGLNIGVDFAFFGNRLTGTAELYKNVTNDLLFDVAIPYLTGFDRIRSNVGKIENKGFELSLTGDIIRNQDFQWSATANFSTNKNEILELTGEDNDGDGIEDDLISSGLFIGESLGAIYDYETNGIYQLGEEGILDGYGPGTYRVVDQNGDGDITPADDRVIIGQSDPAYQVSLLNNFSYKQFSLSVFLNSIQGGEDGYLGNSNTALYRDSNTLFRNNISGIDYWSPSNPDGENALSPFAPGIAGNRYEDRSFVRLQDVNLRYTLPSSFVEKLSISELSIFASGKNLVTWTDWKGWDPETNQGMIANGRPVLKGYSLGINLSF